MTTRRTFIATSLAASIGASLPARVRAASPGSNDAVRVGVIGFKGRGQSHISDLLKLQGVRITALCDVDEAVLKKGYEQIKAKGHDAETFMDIRKMLESKNVDVITTATPNHWHALASIWAIQAGKDVYCEKPVSHNVWEGRKLVEAARKYERIVQTGTQSRSSGGLHAAAAWLRAGNLGKIKHATGTCYKRRASIGKVTQETPFPAGIDKDLWFGPAPIKPLMREKLHYDWHWVWDTGNGDLGNQGIHQMDIARWFLGVDTLSPKVLSIGGRVGYIDDGETANTQIVMHDYSGTPLYFEVRGLPAEAGSKEMDKWRGSTIGVVVQCEGGYLVIPNYVEATAYDNAGNVIQKFKEGDGKSPERDGHMENFIKAVRSRKSSDLAADILEGHLSSALCHTSNISHRLGKKAAPGEIKEKIKGNPEFLDAWGRTVEHLAKNGVDIERDQLSFGEMLQMDVGTERFIGNEAANAMLTREYRAPYVVPDKV